MSKWLFLAAAAAVTLATVTILFLTPGAMLIAFAGIVCVVVAAAVLSPLTPPAADQGATRADAPGAGPDVGIGTVRAIDAGAPAAGSGERLATVEVESVFGETFVGRLRHRPGDPAVSMLRPGVVVLVAFDPATPEELSLADDMLAVRAAFDQMLLRKGLVTREQLELIRHGTRSHGVVTGMRPTGAAREDYREVELDLMVKKPGGGQFPARQTTLIPASSLSKVCPGSVIDTYYRPGRESAIAVCVSAR